MKLYFATYTRQVKRGGVWRDTSYCNQKIVVFAKNKKKAKKKIDYCLSKVEKGDYRAVLNDEITEAYGIDLEYGFEDALYINPIKKEEVQDE